jgi:hypothetical protein
MIILPHRSLLQKKFARCAISWRRGTLPALAIAWGLASTAHAWVTLDLPDLTTSETHGGGLAVSHLSDGQYVYGNNNALYLQTAFGLAANTAFASPPGPTGVDPSFITVLNDTTALVGTGVGGNTPVYQFNPSNTANPNYTTNANMTLQNYAAAPASASSYYVVGTNEASGVNGNSTVSYFGALGGAPKLVIDPAGGNSAGIAVDSGGNVYVGDDDNSSIYEFTAAQVLNAAAHSTALTFSDGKFLYAFSADVVGSLAVDSEGRIWAAGYGAQGLFWFNPATDRSGALDPEDAADNLDSAYTLSTFSANGNNYVSYIWQSGFSSGSTVIYGYDNVQNVPEPATSALLAAAAAGAAAWWKRRRRTAVA